MLDKLAKLLAKQALKLASPIIGTMVTDVGTELVGILIDQRAKDMAENVSGRIQAHISANLRAFANVEGLDADEAVVIETAIASVVGDDRALSATWAAAGFDSKRAAERAVAGAESELRGLDDGHRALARQCVEALFSALDTESKVMDATEPAFRRAVLARLDRLAQAEELTEAARANAIAGALLALPVRRYLPRLSAPGALLRADIECAVPFHGREAELDTLTNWAADSEPFALKLMTGAGGMGKTRLLFELCRRLRGRGWTCGFLEATDSPPPIEALRSLVTIASPLLAVVDYAESRRVETASLVNAMVAEYGRQHIRLVLLARAADDWWDSLRREGGAVGDVIGGPATSRTALRGLAQTPDDRVRSYELAAEHFARTLGRPRAGVAEPVDFSARDFERVLLLHMAALATVDGVQVKGEQGILGHALDRERRFWARRATELGLETRYERAVLQAMAAVTLSGGAADRPTAHNLVRRLRLLEGETGVIIDRIVELLHGTYQGARFIEPLLPDLLGEQLVQVALDDGADDLLDLVLGPMTP